MNAQDFAVEYPSQPHMTRIRIPLRLSVMIVSSAIACGDAPKPIDDDAGSRDAAVADVRMPDRYCIPNAAYDAGRPAFDAACPTDRPPPEPNDAGNCPEGCIVVG